MVDIAGVSGPTVAPDEIATIYGANLATSTAPATPPLPTSLRRRVGDRHRRRWCQPACSAVLRLGGTDQFRSPDGYRQRSGNRVGRRQQPADSSVTPVSPNLFPVGQIVAVHPDGTQTISDTNVPIVFSSDSLYLVLYATGIRNVPSAAFASLHSRQQFQSPGDVCGNAIAIPRAGSGSGAAAHEFAGCGHCVRVFVTADGYASNALALTFTFQ